MKVDSASFKISSISLFIVLPIVIFFTAVNLSQRLLQTWQSFAVACSKTWDLIVGYIFYFNNFWYILFIGIFILALLRGVFYLANQIYKSYLLRKKFNKQILFIKDDVRIIEDAHQFAVTAGFFKPQIYLSSGIIGSLTQPELNAVIAHEQYHQTNNHPLFLLIINSIKSFLFFFPVLRNITSFLSLKYEVLADEFSMSQTSKTALSQALLKVIDRDYSPSFPEAVSTFSTTKDRVNVLVGDESLVLRISRFLLSVSVVMAVLISFTVFGIKINQVNAAVVASQTILDSEIECHSPVQSLMSLVKFGQQSEANMTYDLGQ